MYNIKLPNFEGPFDLLLYFIKRDEINIYDIPISRITGEFLNYVRLMNYFDLDLAGEFLIMAANLMMIKTQMLLPRYEEDEEGEQDDPRRELVQKLLEYKQFKEASRDLSVMADDQKYIFYRKMFEQDNILAKDSYIENYGKASIWELLDTFNRILERNMRANAQHVINIVTMTVDERSDWLVKTLQLRKRLLFSELTINESRQVTVVTFLSLLNLIKLNKIFVIQADTFDDIIITTTDINLN